MLISLILNSLPATPHSPYPCIPHHSYAHTPDTAHSLVAAPAEASAQQLPKHLSSTCRSICAAPAEAPAKASEQHLSKNLRSPCLTAIPYRFAMASMASVKELFSTSILRNSFVAFLQ